MKANSLKNQKHAYICIYSSSDKALKGTCARRVTLNYAYSPQVKVPEVIRKLGFKFNNYIFDLLKIVNSLNCEHEKMCEKKIIFKIDYLYHY